MAQSGVKRAFEPTTLRSVFVKVRPAPRRLSERRAVLRTLQRYGEIEVFQPLTVRPLSVGGLQPRDANSSRIRAHSTP